MARSAERMVAKPAKVVPTVPQTAVSALAQSAVTMLATARRLALLARKTVESAAAVELAILLSPTTSYTPAFFMEYPHRLVMRPH